ncbi:hypothetical protein H632_c2559p0, partial [Helicosporidium sp. ATCC 50920]
WHPDGGSLLAAPGPEGEVALYERLSWQPAGLLSGAHSGRVGAIRFSPNGLYCATAGAADQAVAVWDMERRQVLAKKTLAGAAAALAWHPAGNALALLTEEGELALWEDVIQGENLPGPCENLEARVRAAVEAQNAMDAEAAEASDADEEGNEEEDEEENEEGNEEGEERFEKTSLPLARRAARRAVSDPALAHRPLQPGAFATPPGYARLAPAYLCFNGVGSVVRRPQEDHAVVEVAFHDTSKHRKRLPLISDFLGFGLATLGDKGVLLASRWTSEAAATVQFKPFDAWSSNAEWSATLEHKEHPVSLALGSSFCAVLTSNSRLLLLSLGGLQLASWELPGRGLSLAASGQSLAAFSIQAGQAQPVVELFDVGSRRRLLQTSVPLSRGASVTWAGFAADEEPEERGSRFAAAPPLAVHDSKGVLRVLRPSQGAWAG